MTSSPISVNLVPERPALPRGEVTELDMVIEVLARQSGEDARPRPPLHLCLVIDRSGSMEGPKLERAKRSCVAIFERLRDDDLLTVVAFHEAAEIIANACTPTDQVVASIQSLKAGGRTDLSKGWNQGVLELLSYGDERHIRKLILLSDGKANSGETKKTILGRQSKRAADEYGITTATIGIGDEFQEDLLEALAAESGGRFWYAQTARMEEIINAELQESLSVIVDRPLLALDLPSGIEITEAFHRLRRKNSRYRLRPITSGHRFRFAVRLEVNPEHLSAPPTIRAHLYDADTLCCSGEVKLPLVPIEEYLAGLSQN